MKHINLAVSVSGGRTSAYMAFLVKENESSLPRLLSCDSVSVSFVFANTGMEHDDTLRFLDCVDRNFNLNLVWLEASINPEHGKGTRHRVVSLESAHRIKDSSSPEHPFRAFVAKFGVPNTSFLGCTREMKKRTIDSWLRDNVGRRHTAIGIRVDENRRVSKRAGVENLVYPLVDWWPTDKQDVLDFFSDYSWDLRIPEHLGNCVTCHKKSFKKLKAVYEEHPEYFEFNREMEREFGLVGPEFRKGDGYNTPRSFFRLNTNTDALLKQFDSLDISAQRYLASYEESGGCSESCEVYETEEFDV